MVYNQATSDTDGGRGWTEGSPSRRNTVTFQPPKGGRLRSFWGHGPSYWCQSSNICHGQEGRRRRLWHMLHGHNSHQLVQEPLSDDPEVLEKGSGSFAGCGRSQRNMRYNHHGDPYLRPQARKTLNKVGICLQSVQHTVGAQQMASLNPTFMELPKQAGLSQKFI